jgi:hypothetical protein
MMTGVLVLVGARQEGPCFDVIVFGFCGLVLLECFGFFLYLGFAGVFSFLPSFFMFWCPFLYTSCMRRDAFTLFINFFAYLSKKKKKKDGLILL